MTNDKESHKEIVTASNALIVDIKAIIEQGKRQAYSAINVTVIDMYWKIGQRIVEEEQKGRRLYQIIRFGNRGFQILPGRTSTVL